jgi:hypothetical protein
MKLNENIAYARSILNKNGISPESDDYQDYLKIREICGNNNGYVGILTKLRFVDNVLDMDEIESIFNILKNSKIDVNKLNRLSYENILDMFYEELTDKIDKSDIELYYKDDNYSYYKVHTYKGILKIGSPSWCLKTKSNWDDYQNSYPEQWVVIDNRYSNSLLSPDNNYLSSYSNTEKPWIRYGVSLKNNPDGTVSWTGNDDNNGDVVMKPRSWTFFGIMCTILNLNIDIKKSYYDRFYGAEKINKSWHKVVDKKAFSERLRLDLNTFSDDDDDVYVTFSKSYSFIPVILILNTYEFKVLFPTDRTYKENNSFTKSAILSGQYTKEIIFNYIKDKDNIYFDGIKLKNNMITIDKIKSRKHFMSQFGKWLIFDRNKDWYLVVNTDVDEFEVRSLTLNNKSNDDMKNPMAWYIDKKTMKPYPNHKANDYQIEVINHIKSEFIKDKPVDKPVDKKVKGFWDFLRVKKK